MSKNEQYEKERQEKLRSIVFGKEDNNGRKVYAVYVKDDEFAIYSTGPNCSIRDIAVIIETKDPDNRLPVENFQTIKGDFDKLKSIADRAVDTSYSARVSHALAVAILGDTEKARAILREIHEDIISAYKEQVVGKLIYVTGTFLMAIIVGCVALYLYIVQPELLVKQRPAFYEICLLCAFSTFGGLVSVSRGLTKIDVEKGLGHLPYLLHGIERNVYSIIGGAFIYVLIKSNLLFGFVNSLDNQFYGFMVFGFLAGFSETLIPNALKNLEDRANKESNSVN
jgi:hypothetical protein